MDRIANDKANISAAVQTIDGPVGVSNHRLACKPPNAATTAADVAQSTMASGPRAQGRNGDDQHSPDEQSPHDFDRNCHHQCQGQC